jgi:hypothetical protein
MPAAFLDVSKAFDMVWHQGLFYKLIACGLPPFLVHWLTNFLSGRSMSIHFQGHTSAPITVLRGVPQGAVLSPLLFLIFINDLPRFTSSSPSASFFDILLFADDICIVPRAPSHDLAASRAHLQTLLMSISSWASIWKLQFNSKKSAVIVFWNNRNPPPPLPPLTIQGAPLPFADKYKYLGVIFHCKLSWDDHFSHVSSSLCATAAAVRSALAQIPSPPPPSILLTLVKQCMLTKIAYAICIVSYNQTQASQLDSIVLSLIKSLLRLPPNTCHDSLRLETGIPSIMALTTCHIDAFLSRAIRLRDVPLHPTPDLIDNKSPMNVRAPIYCLLPHERITAQSTTKEQRELSLTCLESLYKALRVEEKARADHKTALSSLKKAMSLTHLHLPLDDFDHGSSLKHYVAFLPALSKTTQPYLLLDTPDVAARRLVARIFSLNPVHPRHARPADRRARPDCHLCDCKDAASSSHLLLDCTDPTLSRLRTTASSALAQYHRGNRTTLLRLFLGQPPLPCTLDVTKSILSITSPIILAIFPVFPIY